MNKNQFRIGILGALIVATLVFSPSAQNVSATHLSSTLGSGATGITITADGVLSDIDDLAIVIDDRLQVGVSSITIDGDAVPATFTSEVSLDIAVTAGDLLIDSVAGDVTITSGLADTQDVFVLGDDITTTANVDTTITSTAGTILIDSLGGPVDINAVGATFDVTIDATDDIIINAAAGADELTIDTGAVTVDGTLTVTGAFSVASIEISGANPTLNFDDTGNPNDDGTISYDTAGGGTGTFTIDVGGVLGVLTLDETGFIELIGGAEIGTVVGGPANTIEIFTEAADGVTGGTISIFADGDTGAGSTAGDIIIESFGTTDGGILIVTGDSTIPVLGVGEIDFTASGAVDINAVTGITINAGTGDLALASSTGAVTIDATDAADDLTLSAGNAVNILADDDNVDITATLLNVDINAPAATGDVLIDAGNLITLEAAAGNILIDSQGAAFDVNIQAGDGVNILADDDEIDITATLGPIDINAETDTTGIVTINAGEDIILTAADALTLSSTAGAISISGSADSTINTVAGTGIDLTIQTSIVNPAASNAGDITIESITTGAAGAGDIIINVEAGGDTAGGIVLSSGFETATTPAAGELLLESLGDVSIQATGNVDIGTGTADVFNLFTATDGAVDVINIGGAEADTITIGGAAGLNVFELRSTGLDVSTTGVITSGTWSATDIAVTDGGTGVSTLTDGGILLGSGAGAITATNVLADGEILIGDGTTDPVALDVGSSAAITILGTVATGVWSATDIAVTDGGTGVSTLTDGAVLLGSGAGAITATTLTNTQIMIGDGSGDPTFAALSGDATMTNAGVVTVVNELKQTDAASANVEVALAAAGSGTVIVWVTASITETGAALSTYTITIAMDKSTGGTGDDTGTLQGIGTYTCDVGISVLGTCTVMEVITGIADGDDDGSTIEIDSTIVTADTVTAHQIIVYTIP